MQEQGIRRGIPQAQLMAEAKRLIAEIEDQNPHLKKDERDWAGEEVSPSEQYARTVEASTLGRRIDTLSAEARDIRRTQDELRRIIRLALHDMEPKHLHFQHYALVSVLALFGCIELVLRMVVFLVCVISIIGIIVIVEYPMDVIQPYCFQMAEKVLKGAYK